MERVQTPEGQELILFYGHNRERNGDKAVFSNFFPCKFTDPEDEVVYSSSEQFMMRHKALCFDDVQVAQKVFLSFPSFSVFFLFQLSFSLSPSTYFSCVSLPFFS